MILDCIHIQLKVHLVQRIEPIGTMQYAQVDLCSALGLSLPGLLRSRIKLFEGRVRQLQLGDHGKRQTAVVKNRMLVAKKSVTLFMLSGVDGVLNDDGGKMLCVH